MPNYPKISIIILNWNRPEDTAVCLDSLKKNNYPNFDVVVVDNGSKGNDANILEKKYNGYIKLIRNEENLGFAGGHNVAINYVLSRQNPPDYVFLLNNDAQVEPDCLRVCIEIAQSTKAGIVGTIINRTRDSKILFSQAPLLNEFFGFKIIPSRIISPQHSFWEVERVQGSAMLISRKLLEQAKKERGYYLRPDYFLYWEETEFCHYTKTRNYRVVVARDAIINHYDGKSTGHDSPLTLYYFTRNRIFLANQILPWYLKILFHFWYMPTRVLRVIQGLLKGRVKISIAILQGVLDGYMNKRGKWKNHKG